MERNGSGRRIASPHLDANDELDRSKGHVLQRGNELAARVPQDQIVKVGNGIGFGIVLKQSHVRKQLANVRIDGRSKSLEGVARVKESKELAHDLANGGVVLRAKPKNNLLLERFVKHLQTKSAWLGLNKLPKLFGKLELLRSCLDVDVEPLRALANIKQRHVGLDATADRSVTLNRVCQVGLDKVANQLLASGVL